jgi:hypothetical protein
MASRPAEAARVFISHQRDVDVRPLLDGLKDQGFDPYVLSDVAILGSELLEALRDAVKRADVVVAVLGDERPNPFFEIGVAYALGKPLLLIVPPGAELPSDLTGQIVVSARPDDLDAIRFVLDQIQRQVRSVQPEVPRPSERALGATAGAELIDRLGRLSRDARSVVSILVEAIEGSGAIAAVNLDPDQGFDLGVWSDDLAAIGGNPLVVEVKRALTPEATSQALHALAEHPTARLALVVQYDDLPRAAVETAQASYPVLTISLEQLIRRMVSASFAEVIRDLRNRSVHGALPS